MPDSPDLGDLSKDYTIRYPLVRPEFMGVILTKDPKSGIPGITPMTCIRATALLEQEPLTPQAASSLVDLVYDYHSQGALGSELKLVQGKDERAIRNNIEQAVESGSIGWLGKILKAAQQVLPNFKPNRLELAGLFKEAYTVEANQPPTERHSEDPERHEVYDTVSLQLKTCATLLGAAEEVLSKSSQ